MSALGVLLDTNVLSETARASPDPGVLELLETHSASYLSPITVYELERGVEMLPRGKRRRALEQWLALALSGPSTVLAFSQVTAKHAAALETRLRRLGHSIETRDLFIAASALEHDLTLVTRNTNHFRASGLTLINPFVADS